MGPIFTCIKISTRNCDTVNTPQRAAEEMNYPHVPQDAEGSGLKVYGTGPLIGPLSQITEVFPGGRHDLIGGQGAGVGAVPGGAGGRVLPTEHLRPKSARDRTVVGGVGRGGVGVLSPIVGPISKLRLSHLIKKIFQFRFPKGIQTVFGQNPLGLCLHRLQPPPPTPRRRPPRNRVFCGLEGYAVPSGRVTLPPHAPTLAP